MELLFKIMETSLSLSARSQQFFVLCRHWEADLEFFRIETAFLHGLLDDYFIQLLSTEFLDDLRHAGQKLFELEKDESSLSKQLTQHVKQLGLAAENIIPEYTEKLAENQATIESLLFKLINEYRAVKKEIFILVEDAMRKKKLITQ
jgi:hypothetical protein